MSDFNLTFDLNDSFGPSNTIPALHPIARAPYKIAFIDEWPSESDFESNQAFSGRTGSILSSILTKLGILKSACMFTYAYNAELHRGKRTPDWHSLPAQKSFNQLQRDLREFKPNLVILVGDNTLRGLGFGKMTTSTWRGSVFHCNSPDSPVYGYKCMCIQHPLIIMKQYSFMPLLLMDLSRAKTEAEKPELTKPVQNYTVQLTPGEVVQKLQALRLARKPVSMDIEGYVNNVTCISFTNTAHEAFIVDLLHQSPSDELTILRAVDEFCSDPLVPKILQNSLYDSFVLAYTYGILIRNIQHDTMLSQWEIYPELPKGLGTQTSIWTNYPYYKSDRKIEDTITHHRYCCTDSDVTLQISNAHQAHLTGSAREHYNFNMKMLNPLLYAQIKGMRYDGDEAKVLLKQVEVKLSEIKQRINDSTYDGRDLNINSPKQMADFLYKEKALPTQYKIEKGVKTQSPTTDVKALLSLTRKFQLPVLSDILLYRKFEKQRQSLNMSFDQDGRVRCSYNVVGTKTGRLSCSQSAHGTGTNLTTVPKQFRKLYLADEGHEFFQCDLAGADGWTVAAHCKALGDPTMLEDYYAGLKPAKLICLLYDIGPEVNKWSREKLLEESKSVGDGWLYFSSKQVQHGSNYGLKANSMSQNIMLQSYKRNNEMILVTPQTCQKLQDLYMVYRYPGVTQWQNRIKNYFSNSRGYPEMGSASGHVRRFFGRKSDHSTHQEAYSQEPQINTTYATNLAIVRMWEDPENRIAHLEDDPYGNGVHYHMVDGSRHYVDESCAPKKVGSLLIEPLHQVHDAACGQFPSCLTEWARKKIRSYFDNTLTIAGTELVIPYDGEYGRSWGEMNKQL